MRVLRSVSEAEVIATFLRAELDSPRYGDTIRELLAADGRDVSLIARPDVANSDDNAYRDSLLGRYRGWTSRIGLFNGFPHEVAWSRVALTRDEVLSILYIDWDWWLRISGGTRRPRDAARRIRAGEIPGATAEPEEPLAARLAATEKLPGLIAVAPSDHSKLVLLEGHVRLTAYALFPSYLPPELEIYLGVSDEIEAWSEF
jgi:hypothetical protein